MTWRRRFTGRRCPSSAMPSTRAVNGLKSEFAVKKRFLDHGVVVSEPIGNYAPYDLVVDTGGLMRVQVKRAYWNEEREKIKVDLRRRKITTDGQTTTEAYTEEEVDWYAFHYPDTDRVYLLPFEEAGEVTVRIAVGDPEDYRPWNREKMHFEEELRFEEKVSDLIEA